MLTASKCDSEEDDYSSDDPSSVCDYILNTCGDNFYATKQECQTDLATMDECRLECALDQNQCDIMDQCLWWAVGYDGEVDNYCGPGNDTDTGSYTDMAGCASAECSMENSACNANADCIGIYEQCYPICADITCLFDCANNNFPNGITDHDNLYTCLENNCSAFL